MGTKILYEMLIVVTLIGFLEYTSGEERPVKVIILFYKVTSWDRNLFFTRICIDLFLQYLLQNFIYLF